MGNGVDAVCPDKEKSRPPPPACIIRTDIDLLVGSSPPGLTSLLDYLVVTSEKIMRYVGVPLPVGQLLMPLLPLLSPSITMGHSYPTDATLSIKENMSTRREISLKISETCWF